MNLDIVLEKTINFVELNHTLVHNCFVNSSSFKPFFHKENIKNLQTKVFTFQQDDISINITLNQIADPIHYNTTGKGFFNSDSLFIKEKDIAYMKITVDVTFLFIGIKYWFLSLSLVR